MVSFVDGPGWPAPDADPDDDTERLAELRWASDALQETIDHAMAVDARYQALIDHLPDTAVYLYDRDHRLVAAGGAGRSVGVRESDLMGKRPEDLVDPEEAARINELIAIAFSGTPVTEEVNLPSLATEKVLDVTAVEPVRPGQIKHVLVVARDITSRRAGERALAAEARYAALLEHSADLMGITDSAGNILYASPGYESLTGLPLSEVTAIEPMELVHPDDRDRVAATMRMVTSQPKTVRDCGCRIRHVDGTYRHIDVVASNRLDDPAVEGIVINVRDMTERMEATERFAHQATHDPLTDLPNRLLFIDRLTHGLARSRREGTRCAVLFIDLDGFKGINDSLGHKAGDEALVAVAQRIEAEVRPGDTVARLGGDEFVVLAEEIPGAGPAHEMAERLRTAITAPMTIGDQTVSVSSSVGIALSDRHHPEALVHEADVALYRAKERGRNRSELYDDAMQSRDRRRHETARTIRSALDAGGVVPAFQPIVDVATGRIVATEALARIRVGDGQMLDAREFISVAEDTDLILPLGVSIIDQACAQQARWSAADSGLVAVGVNLSARELLASDLPSQISAVLDRHHLPADQLCIEITEASLIDAGGSMRRNLIDLKSLGVRLALDDFGTGWSSVAYLRRFPLDIVKVDRSLIRTLGTDDSDAEMIRGVIALSHALRLTTVAEGVETVVQHRQLVEMGCRRAQGHFHGHPVAADVIDLT